MRARVSLIFALSGIAAVACQESRRTAPVAEAIATASLRIPQPDAPPARIVPPAQRALESAARLESQDPLAAAKMAENAIADDPGDPRVPALHLIAGRGRLAHEQALASRTDATQGELAAHREAIAAEARQHPKQYAYSQALQCWVYNGWHFRRVRGDAGLEEEAAWQLTRLTQVRECRGWLPCYVERDVEPLLAFLAEHPHSPRAAEAVERANAAFEENLFVRGPAGDPIAIVDLRLRNDAYDPAALRGLLAKYTAIASTLDPLSRAHASEALGNLWTRVGDVVRARDAYDFIIRNVPDYANLDEVGRKRRRLS